MKTVKKSLSRKIKIGSVQINNSFSGQSYLPYSTAILQSYLLEHVRDPQSIEFLLPIFSRVKVEDAINQLIDSDIAMFSTYVWNIRLSLAIAENLKREKPETTIIFGGPQVPDFSADFLKANKFIDIAVHGEGERVLNDIIDNHQTGDWRDSFGLSYLDSNGKFVQKIFIQKIIA